MPDTQISDEMVELAAQALYIAMDSFEADVRVDSLTPAERQYLARCVLTAALSGHVVVPREPTSRMICAALDDGDKRGHSQTCGDVYRAMIQAAPPVPEMEG